MSISSITPYTTLNGLQPLQQPVAVNNPSAATVTTLSPTSGTTSLTSTQSTSTLLSALDQTLAQFGLNANTLAAVGGTDTGTAEGVAAQNAIQASQAFLGALYQAAAQSQESTTASSAAATNAAATASYTSNTSFDLTSFLQQLESGSSNTAAASTGSTQVSSTGTLAALQANFDNLLNSASAVSSQAAAAANSASPTLQNFVQTLAQNLPNTVTAVAAISPYGNLLETTA